MKAKKIAKKVVEKAKSFGKKAKGVAKETWKNATNTNERMRVADEERAAEWEKKKQTDPFVRSYFKSLKKNK
jgi:hypothetical protein